MSDKATNKLTNQVADNAHNELMNKFKQLSQTMRQADQFHTLEEQVDDMKCRGIDPSDSYKKWDDEKDDRND